MCNNFCFHSGAAFDVVDSQRPDAVHMAHSTNRWHFLGFYVGGMSLHFLRSHRIDLMQNATSWLVCKYFIPCNLHTICSATAFTYLD